MKRKGIVLFLSLCLMLSIFPPAAMAAEPATERTLVLTENWRLTDALDLGVPANEVLVIDGTNGYYLYEMSAEAVLKNTGDGIVRFKNTRLYHAGDTPQEGSLAALLTAANGVTSINAPAMGVTELTLPTVSGYDVSIKSSSNEGVIALDRTITPPAGTTTVNLVLTLKGNGGEADTGSIAVLVPGVSSGGGSGGGGGPASEIVVTTGQSGDGIKTGTEVAGTSSAGVVSAGVSPDVMKELLAKAGETDEISDKDIIEIAVDTPEGTEGLIADITQAGFLDLAENTDASFSIFSPFITITFDGAAVETIAGAATGGSIVVSAGIVDAADLSEADQVRVKGRPVYDLTVTASGSVVSGFGGGQATVGIPYTLQPGEDADAIVVWYLTDDGTLQAVNGRYDAATGSAVFTTGHFSAFVIGHNLVVFSDVDGSAWYHSAVIFIAARGITTGTGSTVYSPDAKLTRGEFIVMLMRAYGIEPDINPLSNFADAGNTWYTGYLAAAKRLGISDGTGNNLYAPDTEISRQDMFTLLYRTLDLLGAIPGEITGNSLSNYQDLADIADYAKEAIAALVEKGVVTGSAGKLDPLGASTRAQMAQVLYNLLSR